MPNSFEKYFNLVFVNNSTAADKLSSMYNLIKIFKGSSVSVSF